MHFKGAFMDLLTTILAVVLLVADDALAKRRFPTFDESFFMPQHMREKFVNITIRDRDGDLISAWSEGGDVSLTKPPVPTDIQTCPWTYVVVHNPNRIPDTILEAVCLQNQCSLLGNTVPPETSNAEIHDSTCHPIKYFRWVKVRTHKRSNGQWRYVRRLLPVTVACTCLVEDYSTDEQQKKLN